MRDFVFLTKNEPIQKAILRVDIIDDKSENFTIMWMDGIEGTVFEKYFPWKLGEVITEDEIEALLIQFQPVLTGVKYGEDTVKTFGVEEHELTITPNITNGDETFIIVSCKNEYDVAMKKTVPLKDGVPTKVEIVEGFEYSFELIGADTWTVDTPEPFTCDGDEAVTLAVSVPIDLPVHTLTITPTLTDATETSVMLIGTLTGYSSTNTPVNLEDGEDVDVDIYEGYSYEFALDSDDSWTGGSAPAAIVCDGDETAALAITVVTV